MSAAQRILMVILGMMISQIGGIAFGQIITNETGTASTELGGVFDRLAVHAVDDSGLGPGDNFASTPDQTHNALAGGFVWLTTAGDPNPTYTVTFDNLFSITGFRVFNYNEAGSFTTRGVQLTNILVSLDGVNFVPLLNNVLFAQAPGTGTYTGQFFDLVLLTGGNVTARAIQFDIQSNYGDAQNFYGLSELQFDGLLVPEPTSSTLMAIGGLGLVILLYRRGKAEGSARSVIGA